MVRRIYWILMLLSITIGGIILYSGADFGSKKGLLTVLTILAMIFIASIHGIIAHSLKPSTKGNLILYPLLMGVLFVFLFFIFVFFITPLFCPDIMG